MGNLNRKTLFTKIVNREIPSNIIYEDENHLAFLSIEPFEKGHTLVIPKKSYLTIMDMPESEFLNLQKVILKIAKSFEDKLNCGINIGQNNKKIAGQEVDHVHFHIIPRLIKKQLFVNGNFESYSNGEEKEIAEKLRLND